MAPPIANFLPNALIDYPGKLACEVFLAGCNYKCPGCHSYPVVNGKSNVSPDDVVRFANSRKGWIDGIVVCGGEPTIHADLPELLERFRKSGLAIKLDTNGSNPEVLRGLIDRGLVNYVALDVKSDAMNYDLVTGVAGQAKNVEESMRVLSEQRRQGAIEGYETRTTLWPFGNGELRFMNEKEADNLARWVRNCTQDDHTHFLQKFKAREVGVIIDPRFALGNLPAELAETPDGLMKSLQRAMLHYLGDKAVIRN